MEYAYLIPIYNCNNNPSVETFIETVEQFKTLAHLNDEQTASIARLRMGEKAAEFLRNHGEPIVKSWKQCEKLLLQFFGRRVCRRALEYQLSVLKQMPNETVCQYYSRVLQMARDFESVTVFSDSDISASIKSSIAERVKFHFVTGLHSDINRFVRVQCPRDLSEAVRLAQIEEMHVIDCQSHELYAACNAETLTFIPSDNCATSVSTKKKRAKHRLCFVCKQKGHIGKDCRRK
jgi:hypothetical protein